MNCRQYIWKKNLKTDLFSYWRSFQIVAISFLQTRNKRTFSTSSPNKMPIIGETNSLKKIPLFQIHNVHISPTATFHLYSTFFFLENKLVDIILIEFISFFSRTEVRLYLHSMSWTQEHGSG